MPKAQNVCKLRIPLSAARRGLVHACFDRRCCLSPCHDVDFTLTKPTAVQAALFLPSCSSCSLPEATIQCCAVTSTPHQYRNGVACMAASGEHDASSR